MIDIKEQPTEEVKTKAISTKTHFALTPDGRGAPEMFGDYPSCGCKLGEKREYDVGPDWLVIHPCKRCGAAPIYLSKKTLEIFTGIMNEVNKKKPISSHKPLNYGGRP